MMMNKLYTRAAEFFHDIGRWCEHKSLMVRLGNGKKVTLLASSIERTDIPPTKKFDHAEWVKNEEVREALIRGYTTEKNKCPIPPSSCVEWTGPNWNEGNSSYDEEDRPPETRDTSLDGTLLFASGNE